MALTPILLAVCLSLGHCQYDAFDDYLYSFPSKNNSHNRKGDKVVFGTELADIDEFPSTVFLELNHWLVAEDVEKPSWCGGSIISRYWLVTAADCLECCPGIEDSYYTIGGSVRAGSSKIATIGMIQDLVEYVIHTEFRYSCSKRTSINNIGLIKVEFGFPLGAHSIAAARLPESNQVLPGRIATAVGWVFPWVKDTPLDDMMKVMVVVINHQQCREELRQEWRDDGSQFCTLPASKEVNRNISFGSSGNPVYGEGGMLIGVISWALPGRSNVEATGNTNIAYFRDWIRDIAEI